MAYSSLACCGTASMAVRTVNGASLGRYGRLTLVDVRGTYLSELRALAVRL